MGICSAKQFEEHVDAVEEVVDVSEDVIQKMRVIIDSIEDVFQDKDLTEKIKNE